MDERAGGRWLPSRRETMLGGLSALSLTALKAAADARASRPQMARGFVLEDTSDDLGRSPSSKGLGGVMVSNGHDVVSSAEDGSWSLPISPGDCLFVVKPSGWAVTGAAGRRNSFFYLHQPEGSPAGFTSRFAGVHPTGALPSSIDFVLRRAPEPSRFDVLMVADTQPGNEQELDFVRDAVLSRAASTGAAFAIHHGDVMGDDLALYERYTELLAETGIAWHHCPGNHDMNCDAGDGALAFETWKRVFGPTYYAFQHGGATFMVLNNVGPPPVEHSTLGYCGMIGARQLDFVRNVLAHVPRDQLVVLSMHIPLTSHEDPASLTDTTVDRDRLLELLGDRPNAVSFSGHCHTNERHYLGGGSAPEHHHHVLAAACGNWWSGPPDSSGVPISHSPDGSPKSFHILSIDADRWSIRRCSAPATPEQTNVRLVVAPGRNEDMRGRLAERSESAEMPVTGQIVVNVFDGGPRTKVWLEIMDTTGVVLEMQKTDMCDPHVVSFIAQHAATCKPWAYAARSSHIWSALLPSSLHAGRHRIRARAIDEAGFEVSEVFDIRL